MQAPARRRMTADERRGVILDKAKALFAARGYAATSLDDVAAAAGVTKPVIYDHFASKRDLYGALMGRLRDELLREASAALSEETPPQKRFRAAIENYFRQVQRDPAIVELLFVQPRTEPQLMSEWRLLETEAIAALVPLVGQLAPTLKPWQRHVAAHLLHHGLNATASAWPRGIPAQDMANLVVALFWQGLKNAARVSA